MPPEPPSAVPAPAAAGAPVAALSAEERAAVVGRRRTALLSVGAASVLVVLKLVTGLITGSLGLLAEAAHSGADLVAALLTLFAIQVAVRPADSDHQFGHGKAEHLAALAESAFLIAVSSWLGYEAISRLAEAEGHAVDAAWWAIAVIVLVIAIDLTRMVASHRASERYGSPALAANALHFAGDLAGSVAVLLGLVGVALGWHEADAVAALVVAVLVIGAALRLLRGSIDVLMDRADRRAETAVREAIAHLVRPDDVRRVRTRQAAGRSFVDVVLAVRSDAGLELAHDRADQVEGAIAAALPGADVVVHVEPTARQGGTREAATAAALRVPRVHEVHNVDVFSLDGGEEEVMLHVKVPPALTLHEGHEIAEQVEARIHGAVGAAVRVTTHIEPLGEPSRATQVPDVEAWAEHEAVDAAVREETGRGADDVQVRDTPAGRMVLVTVALPGDCSVGEAHGHAARIERGLRDRCPWLGEIVVHTEPAAEPPAPAG
ncbi:cation diffusion facilitator family transporter [Patulibacter sp. SYSU D01012]|uniref:cation diffusion facilitator family transporter n=1 Tax=Patulibacter sp. SYSU D01012 TaxID=2817381 RepID=UPI001B313649